MSKFKKGLMKRVLAVILSGAMVMSNMTAFASEAPTDTSGYVEEVADDVDGDDSTDSESADEEEVEDNAEVESTSEDAATEETTKSEDNASNGKDDTDDEKKTEVENVEATDTEVVDEEQTSEVESSLSVETEEVESTEKTETEEDVKEATAMTEGQTYILDVNKIDASAVQKTEGYVASINDVFEIICGGSTVIDTGRNEAFYYITDTLQAKKVPFTQRLALGGSPSKTRQSIKFTTAGAVDVTVYWMSKGTSAQPRQMSILGDDGKQKVATDEITIFNNSMYVSTMTLDDAGTYYLGGNNYIYKVIVEPKGTQKENAIPDSIISNEGKNITWNFADKSVFPEMIQDTEEGLVKGAEGCLVKYCGLEIDGSKNNPDVLGTGNATLGKIYVRSDNNVQINQNTVIRIPINGRSNITFTMYSGAETYSVDGVAAKNGKIQTFTCNGEDGYATFIMLKGGEYLQKIEVEKINEIAVSGKVSLGDGVAIPEGLEVIFTDTKDKTSIIKDTVGSDGSYSVTLYEGSTYDISLSGNYDISVPANKQIAVESSAITNFPITASSMNVNEVSVSVTFETGTAPDNFALKFKATEGTHSATAALESDNTYKASLEKGKTYTVSLAGTGMKDYEASPAEISADTASQAITIKARKKRNVTLETKSFDDKVDFSNVSITFKDIGTNEDDTDTAKYEYTSKISDNNVALRDGTYSVSLSKEVEYPYQFICPDLEVNGDNTYKYIIDFKERTTWDFTIADPVLVGGKIGQGGINTDGSEKYKDDQFYNGLYINTGLVKDSEGNYLDASGNVVEAGKALGGKFDVRVSENRVQVNNSTKVKIPVSGRGTVAISPADGSFKLKKLTDKDQDASGIADQNKNGEITYNEDTRYILMEATGLVWLTKIEVTRDPAVEVGGKISGPEGFDISNFTVAFINQTDDSTIPVTVKADGTYSVKLTSGHTYVATLSGDPQYGFSETCKTIEVKNSDIPNANLTVEAKSTIKYSGKITGFAADYKRLDNLKVILTAGADKKELTIDKTDKENISFEAVLESGVEYTIKLEGVDDYSLTSEETIQKTANYTANITVEAKPTYEVSGKFLELDGAEITKVLFTRLNEEGAPDKNYVYEAVVNDAGDGYSAQLRDGEYEASAEVNGYATKTHVIVNGGKVVRDLLFIWTDTSKLDYKADLYVGYDDREDSYNTITKALKVAKRMSPSADKRITIHIAPGTYREQITVDVPYITFKNDTPSEEVKLTWYYGIGYQYYSIKPSLAENGFYDAEYAYNKTEKHTAFRWGCTVLVKATDFRAENIIFENSFNKYLTKEEIADGVEPIEQKEKKPERNSSLDLRSKAAGERAAALYIEDQGDRAEFYNCQFLSNQDTIGTGSTTPRSYFKDCLIEGNTDYICGAGDAVFDNCELRFAGYSDASSGGYITAASTPRQYGYLFWNCTVTGTTNSGANKDIGYLGRPWNKKEDTKLATVTFVNTVLDRADIIEPVGWHEMGGFEPSAVHYKEYNTTVKGGSAADTSKRTAGTVVTENPVTDMTVYFGGWTPAYYNHVDAPTADVEPGKVPKGTKVALECATQGAAIHYTTNGDEPTAQSAIYESGKPISLDTEGEVVIKAIAIKGDVKSEKVEFAYTVVDAEKFVDVPVADVKPDKVSKGTEVTLTCATQGAEIRYTTNGENPTVESTLFEEAIVINESVTIKAIAVKGDAVSDIATFKYTVEPEIIEPETVAKPIADRPDGVVPVGKTVTLQCEEGAKIYYTTDGTTPTESSTEYTTPIELGNEAKTIVIKAIAVKDGVKSEVATFTYTVSADIDPDKFVSAPVSDVKNGEVPKGTKVTLTSATADAKIYYTMDGTDPTAESTEYAGPIDLGNEAKKVVIKAIAIKDENKSSISTFEYTVTDKPDDPNVPGTVALPTADINPGEVPVGMKVTLTAPGAKIYYTLDETTPTESSTEYTAPIELGNEAKTIVIKAIAVKDGVKSEVATFTYTVSTDIDPDKFVSAPVSDVKDGEVPKGTKVTLTSATTDAKIYYTMDGTDPTAKSTEYAGPIELGNEAKKVVIKAIAIKGDNKSSISTFEYTVTGEQKPPVTPEDPDDPGDDKTDIWITGLEAEYYYTGAKIIPDIKVWDCDIKGNDRLLIPGVDYAAAYKNNSKVSTESVKAEVIITGKGNYAGKGVTEKFSIVPAKGVENPVNVKGAKIDKIKEQQYNQGKAIYPDFKLTLKGKTAVTYTYNNGSYARADGEPMDINVAVSNNVNQGKAAILVTGAQEKGKTTSVKAAFKITPIDLSKVTLDVEAKPAAYAVKGAIPVLTVKYDGKTLVNGRDYVAKYGNNKKAGVNGSVTISGKGNYAKNANPVSFDVKQLDMSELSVSAATVYDKVKAGRIKATVLDKAGNELKPAQYTLEVYKADGTKYGANDVLKAGETVSIAAVAKDKVNLTGSTPKADFKVGKDISKAKFKLKKSVKKSYTGSEVELIATDFEPVTLKGASGTLEMGRDFEIVDYSNNINKGNATAIIKGIGDYSGTKTIKFKITQKTMVKGSTTPAN